MRKSFWLLFGLALMFVSGVGWLAALVSASTTVQILPSVTFTEVVTAEALKIPSQSSTIVRPTQEPSVTLKSASTLAKPSRTIEAPVIMTSSPKPSPQPPPDVKKVTLPKMLLASAGKLREDFEKVTEWVKVSGSNPAANSELVQTGSHSLQVTAGSTKTVVEKKVVWDLSKSECNRLWVFRPKRVNGDFEISLANSSNFSRYFMGQVTPNPIGWSLVQICRGDFTNVHNASWNDPIVKIRLQVNPNDEILFDSFSSEVLPIPVVMIHFDDANASDYTLAYPVLEKYGIAATEYVPTNFIGSPEHLTVAQLLELQSHGWTVGNHTTNHIRLKELSRAEQEQEMIGALKMLESWGISGGKFLAFPEGKYSGDTQELLSQYGFRSGRTVSNAPDVFPQVNLFILRTTQDVSGMSLDDVKKLIDEGQRNHRILTLLFHGLQVGNQTENGWNQVTFENLMAYIAEKQIYTMTIEEFVRLAEGPVKVRAPKGAR